jgi:hypothetical protein
MAEFDIDLAEKPRGGDVQAQAGHRPWRLRQADEAAASRRRDAVGLERIVMVSLKIPKLGGLRNTLRGRVRAGKKPGELPHGRRRLAAAVGASQRSRYPCPGSTTPANSASSTAA